MIANPARLRGTKLQKNIILVICCGCQDSASHRSLNHRLLKSQRLPRMRHTLSTHLNLRMPLRLIIRHLNIVLEHQPRQNHLNLIGSEEATRARMASVPETEVSLVGSDELVARNICCLAALAQVVGADTVEFGGRRVVLAVLVDGCSGDFDENAGGDVLAVAEGYAFENAATEGC